jgi:hypothetical protein
MIPIYYAIQESERTGGIPWWLGVLFLALAAWIAWQIASDSRG